MRILVTGGCGFVGSALVPMLLAQNHVTVVDLMLFNNHLEPHPNLTVVAGDIRSMPQDVYRSSFDALIHLACIANDPSWALDPVLGKSINYYALGSLMLWAKDTGVQRCIYASSSSVYGTKPDGVEVTEDLPLVWLTDYSKYKALSEDVVMNSGVPSTVLRPATVCGYSSRVRLDVVVNQMTIDALVKGEIVVHSGGLSRAHLHIDDMARAYVAVLGAPLKRVAGQVFNVGAENLTIRELAERVRVIAGGTITDHAVTNDPRSYTLNSDKIGLQIGFAPLKTSADAITDVCNAFRAGLIPDPLAPRYYNLKQMQALCVS